MTMSVTIIAYIIIYVIFRSLTFDLSNNLYILLIILNYLYRKIDESIRKKSNGINLSSRRRHSIYIYEIPMIIIIISK